MKHLRSLGKCVAWRLFRFQMLAATFAPFWRS